MRYSAALCISPNVQREADKQRLLLDMYVVEMLRQGKEELILVIKVVDAGSRWESERLPAVCAGSSKVRSIQKGV